MGKIILQTGTFLLIIILGYLFKKLRILKKEDAQVLGTIIMNVTMPCLFLSSANSVRWNEHFLLLMGMGFLVNLFMLTANYLIRLRRDGLLRGVHMLTGSGYDVGNSVIPFVSTFYPGEGMAYLISFNIANTIMVQGMNFVIVRVLNGGGEKNDFRKLAGTLFSSLPLDAYLLILFLAATGLSLPQPFITVASSIASANSFLVMFMIGLRLEFRLSGEDGKDTISLILFRFLAGILFSLLTFFLIPLPRLARTVLVMAYFASPSAVASIYARKLGYTGALVADVTMVGIMIAILMQSVLLMIV